MADRALLFYGLSEADARLTTTTLGNALGITLDLISASGREQDHLNDILENPSRTFEECEVRFVMFLGFDDKQIGEALQSFPLLSVSRPIFCTLTRNNLSWTIAQLAEHLVEEDKTMRKTAPPQ
jgi:hypothetical protein